MVENLDKFGHNSKVFAPTYDRKLAIIEPNENVLVSECFKKWDRLFFGYKQKKICNSIEKHYNLDNFDLIHAYTLYTDGNAARTMSKKYGVPYVVAVRNTDVNTFFKYMPHLRGRGVKIMLDAKAVFFLSEAYRKQVFDKYVPKKYHGQLKEKTYIVPNGIDDFWFDNQPMLENRLDNTVKLVYAGRIDRNKNIETTQKAMEMLRSRGINTSLTVVGKVVDEKVYSKIKDNPHTECVHAKPKEELLEIYRKHNIFVMPSFTESFGLVYVEAMSQGLPVVYSAGQGFDNQFPEGTVGYRVSAYDAQSVADGIEKIIRNFEGIASRTVPSAKIFNWNDITVRYGEIYKSILKETGD